MSVLQGLKPERVFYYFEELCKIPHGSGNTKQISDYCVEFAKKQGLKVIQDSVNNVIIYKDGSEGYEASDPVILQGHLDMVCEKTGDSKHNFETDPLEIYVEDGRVSAKDTSLGADNAIAVAMAMAVLEDEETLHPPIEAVFTVDEETSMNGAQALDMSLLKGKMLINMDSEEEGFLIVGCAGGTHLEVEIPLKREERTGTVAEITMLGLLGGHSGAEIHKQRGNAHKIMGRLLYHLSRTFTFELIEINGGSKDNVIAKESKALLLIEGDSERFVNEIKAMEHKLQVEFGADEPDFGISVTVKDDQKVSVCNQTSTTSVIRYLSLVPNGVQVYERALESQVETSLNIGSVKTGEHTLKAVHLIRSSRDSQSEALKEQVYVVAESVGAKATINSEFPGWAYRQESRLRDIMTSSYEEQYGEKPGIYAIHAGLECGLFLGKAPELDCVSFGPNLFDVHSTAESMEIASVERSYRYLLNILKNCK